MPDQLFTYYIEISLVVIIIKSGSWGDIVYLAIGKTWVISKGDAKRGN
jgi:hypothetical protein